jgi:hypothetical protein
MPDFRDADPRDLRLPSSMAAGADPHKLQRQLARFGTSTAGMPPILVREGIDGMLLILDGVTGATRVAKLLPGVRVPVEVVLQASQPFAGLPKIGDTLP